MTTTIPDLTHPGFCHSDIPTDDGGVIHLSVDRAVQTSTADTMTGFIHVSVERRDAGDGVVGAPSIRIEGSADEMTPLAAFELASTLQAVAIAALLEVSR